VFMRPCLLWPWYIPWVLDSYATDTHVIRLTPPFTAITYLNATDAEIFYEKVAALTASGIITDKHLANLKDNNDNIANRARVFHFQAVFIPHRFVQEFMALLAEFKDTALSPSVYVPFIFQLLWDKNSWHRLTSEANNNTIYASTQPLLTTCQGDTVEATMTNVNHELVQQLAYFAYGWCGWLSPLEEIEYITKTITKYVRYHIYEFLFWGIFSVLVLAVLWCIRRRIYDAYLKCKLRFPNMQGYRKFDLSQPPVRSRQMDKLSRNDDDDDKDASINI